MGRIVYFFIGIYVLLDQKFHFNVKKVENFLLISQTVIHYFWIGLLSVCSLVIVSFILIMWGE